MWKLLSKRDRRNVRQAEGAEPSTLTVLTTSGIGAYSCVNCQRYNHAPQDGEGPGNCVAQGIPPDTMPCAFSPKKPELYFLPNTVPVPVGKALLSMDLPEMLIMRALLGRQIDLLVAREALNLPYRPGEQVTFVHNQMLKTAEVLDFDRDTVTVRVDDTELALPHATVIPPKRKNGANGENPKDSGSSEVIFKQNQPLPVAEPVV